MEPVAILDSRTKQPEVADKEQEAAEKQRTAAQLREFLVKWPDQEEPEWVSTVLIICTAGTRSACPHSCAEVNDHFRTPCMSC